MRSTWGSGTKFRPLDSRKNLDEIPINAHHRTPFEGGEGGCSRSHSHRGKGVAVEHHLSDALEAPVGGIPLGWGDFPEQGNQAAVRQVHAQLSQGLGQLLQATRVQFLVL